MAKAPAPKKIKIKLLRDYWFEGETRTYAGTIFDIDEDAGKIAINNGLAEFHSVSDNAPADEPAKAE
jgi:hypothetical protein